MGTLKSYMGEYDGFLHKGDFGILRRRTMESYVGGTMESYVGGCEKV